MVISAQSLDEIGLCRPIEVIIERSSRNLIRVRHAYEVQEVGRTPITKLYGLHNRLARRTEIQQSNRIPVWAHVDTKRPALIDKAQALRCDSLPETHPIFFAGERYILNRIGTITAVKHIGVVARSTNQRIVSHTAHQNIGRLIPRQHVIQLIPRQIAGGIPHRHRQVFKIFAKRVG